MEGDALVVSSFPLIHLPNNALMQVLRDIDLFQQLNFSMISKKAKNLAKALNLRAQFVNVSLEGAIEFEVTYNDLVKVRWYFRVDEPDIYDEEEEDGFPIKLSEDDESLIKLSDTCSVTAEDVNLRQSKRWEETGFEIRHWMNNLISILNISQINELVFRKCDVCEYDVDSLKETLNGLDIVDLGIDIGFTEEYSLGVVKNFLPTKKFSMGDNPFQSITPIHNLLILNLEVLSFDDFSSGYLFFDESDWEKVKLDDLLLMNSSIIRIYESNLDEKVLNRFLKHWINGSNPRLESLRIGFQNGIELDENLMMNGVNHFLVSNHEERIFKQSSELWEETIDISIKEGFDIQRYILL